MNIPTDFELKVLVEGEKSWLSAGKDFIDNHTWCQALIVPSGYDLAKLPEFDKDILEHDGPLVLVSKGTLPYRRGREFKQFVSYVQTNDLRAELKPGRLRVSSVLQGPILFANMAASTWLKSRMSTSSFSDLKEELNSSILSGEVRAFADSLLICSGPKFSSDRVSVGKTPKFNFSEEMRTVTIVTRTINGREDFLSRNIEAVREFKIAAKNLGLQVDHVVVGETALEIDDQILRFELLVQPTGQDTRFKAIQLALKEVTGDYVWFIDDDDFVLPSFAESLRLYFEYSSDLSPIFVNVEQRIQTNFRNKSVRGRIYLAQDSIHSVGARNLTPFCGVIFPFRQIQKFTNHIFDNVTLLEDHLLISSVLGDSGIEPHFLPVTAVVTNLHDRQQAITSVESLRWQRSALENYFLLSNVVAPTSNLTLEYATLRSSIPRPRFSNLPKLLIRPFMISTWLYAHRLRIFQRLLNGTLSLKSIIFHLLKVK